MRPVGPISTGTVLYRVDRHHRALENACLALVNMVCSSARLMCTKGLLSASFRRRYIKCEGIVSRLLLKGNVQYSTVQGDMIYERINQRVGIKGRRCDDAIVDTINRK